MDVLRKDEKYTIDDIYALPEGERYEPVKDSYGNG